MCTKKPCVLIEEGLIYVIVIDNLPLFDYVAYKITSKKFTYPHLQYVCQTYLQVCFVLWANEGLAKIMVYPIRDNGISRCFGLFHYFIYASEYQVIVGFSFPSEIVPTYVHCTTN